MILALAVQEWFWLTLTLVMFVLILGPAVFSWMGLTRFKCQTIGSAAEITLNADTRELEFIDELESMRFVPLGVRLEKANFLGPHWSWNSGPQRVFISPDQLSTAVIYQVAGRGPFVSFQSCYSDGDLLSTTNNTVCDLSDVEGFNCYQVETRLARDVYAGHQQNLNDYPSDDEVLTPIKDLAQSNQNTLTCNLRVAEGRLYKDLGRSVVQVYQSLLVLGIICATLCDAQFGTIIQHYCLFIDVTLIAVSLFLLLAFRFITPDSKTSYPEPNSQQSASTTP
jgi:hypothetical protein